MEDNHYIQDSYLDNPRQAFFGVYDGHGGKGAADFAATKLHLVLANSLKEAEQTEKDSLNPQKIEDLLSKTFEKVDADMKPTVPAAGCTAVVALVKELNGERHLCVANVGDARAVLSRGGKAQRLTFEHKATDPAESQRINDAGGFLVGGRVNGIIAVARALGDHNMKQYIIGTPYTSSVKLTDEDDFLVLACDGIWDTVDDQQAIDLLRENTDLPVFEMCKKLYSAAVKGGSLDNITVIVIKLK